MDIENFNKLEYTKENVIYLYISKKLTSIQIGKIFKKHKDTITWILREQGVKTRRSTKNPKITKAYLNREYLKLKRSTNDIARELRCSNRTISKWLKKYKIKARSFYEERHRKYCKPDLKAIEKCNTQQMAYFLGFVAADGHFSSKRGGGERLTLEIQTKDEPLLYEFIKLLKIDNKIRRVTREKTVGFKKTRYASSLQISCCGLKKALGKFGLADSKKSRKITIDKNISKDLVRHFIRGYFDGDGCIYYNARVYPAVTFTSCSITILRQLKDIFRANLFSSRIYKSPRRSCHNLYVHVNKKNIKAFYAYLYKNSEIHLKRKHDKFVTVLENL